MQISHYIVKIVCVSFYKILNIKLLRCKTRYFYRRSFKIGKHLNLNIFNKNIKYEWPILVSKAYLKLKIALFIKRSFTNTIATYCIVKKSIFALRAFWTLKYYQTFQKYILCFFSIDEKWYSLIKNMFCCYCYWWWSHCLISCGNNYQFQ